MYDFDILQDLIQNDALVLAKDEYNKKIIVLKESGNQQPEYSLKIRNVPDDIIAFKADAFPPPNNIFKNSKGECKQADYVVIASDDRANWIVHIEMKSGKGDSEKEVEQQLRGAQCLVAYCRAIGQEFWQEQDFLEKKNYQQRFISIKNIGVAKRETLIEPKSGRHDMPERMLKISTPANSNLQFKRLVGKA